KRGVRAIIMYPMNALVSDQIARLRKIIGKDEFIEVFSKLNSNARRPQFGMYTGRTPYPGAKSQKKDDIDLADKLRELITEDERFTNSLQYKGKDPAQGNWEEVINKLENQKQKTN